MRFKVEENLSGQVVRLLRGAGHDAEGVREEGLAGAADACVLAAATAEGRALVILDLGFGDVRAYPPCASAGIIILRPPSQDRPTVLSLPMRTVALLPEESPGKRLWIVDAPGARIHD